MRKELSWVQILLALWMIFVITTRLSAFNERKEQERRVKIEKHYNRFGVTNYYRYTSHGH